MPPRHGKTTLVSKRWPAYLLGRYDWMQVALISYSAELIQDASRSVRSMIRDEPLYRQLFPGAQISQESAAVHRWSLDGHNPDNPSVVATGVGGPLVGRGFHLIVIDDPLKGREEAESEAMRAGLKAWYQGTLRTRLEPGGAIVIVMTRWHEDDLVGWLLSQEAIGEGEHWEIVNLPAIAERVDAKGKKIKDPLGRKAGAALWPERWPIPALVQLKTTLGGYDWESQYQGHPKPPKGSKILREWLKVIPAEKVPKGLQWARYWDLAISTKTSASYTASARVAYDAEGNLYVAGMVRGKWEWPAQRKVIKTSMAAEKPLGVIHGIESALHGTAAVQEFRKDKELRAVAFKKVDVSVDKLTRALPWIAMAEAGCVYLVEGPWVSEFLDEAAAFTGKNDLYDDQIDTVSGGVALLDQYGGKLVAKKNPFYK